MAVARWIVGLSMSLLLGLSAARAQDKKKPLAIEDLYLMESVKSPTLFPSPLTPLPGGEGKGVREDKLVYERVWIDSTSKHERHSLWLVTGKRENRKTLEKDEPDGRSPVVSPDGKWIAFLSNRRYRIDHKAAKQPTFSPLFDRPVPLSSDAGVDIWIYNVAKGYAFPLGDRDRSWGHVFHDVFYGRVAFSPDSKKLIFVADDGKDPRTKEEIDSDVEIVRPDQGEGYTGYGPAQIWIAEVESKKITRLTDDDIWYGDPQWSPDGKSLVVVANKSKDRESVRYSINKNFDLYLIDVATKKQTQLTTNPGPDVSPRWSPDGKQIAYLSSPRNGPHRDVFNLGIVALENGEPRSHVLLDLHKPPGKVAPVFPLPLECWVEKKITFRIEGLHRTVVSVDAEGEKIKISSAQRTLSDIWAPEPSISDRLTSDGSRVEWRNDDFELDGILTTPPPEVAKPPYKLIVYPHGGPHSRSTSGFDFTVQLFAAHGYAVFQPNFRGSTGYGKKFLDANRLDLGGGDMRDILTGIDQLVKEGKVDPKRQFVYGISYGGFMASWLVGHTHQFRAAVAQNAVTDMNMMYGLSDLQSWTTWELGGLPWEQPDRYKKHSPLTYANKVKTPTLILHARDDRRCPLPMGKAFHQALLANGVPTQMVIYPNEGHGIRQPRHREDVYRRVLAWFAKHDVKKNPKLENRNPKQIRISK